MDGKVNLVSPVAFFAGGSSDDSVGLRIRIGYMYTNTDTQTHGPAKE